GQYLEIYPVAISGERVQLIFVFCFDRTVLKSQPGFNLCLCVLLTRVSQSVSHGNNQEEAGSSEGRERGGH
ncbi:hypothetical protein GBAR_LOCUS8817, partial [Geodia barretti]